MLINTVCQYVFQDRVIYGFGITNKYTPIMPIYERIPKTDMPSDTCVNSVQFKSSTKCMFNANTASEPASVIGFLLSLDAALKNATPKAMAWRGTPNDHLHDNPTA